MANIIHRVGVRATVAEVYNAVATISGIATWWTEQTSGLSQIDELIETQFFDLEGKFLGRMEIVVKELATDERVLWEIQNGPSEWIGTEVSFDLRCDENFTILLFKHAQWKEPSEFMAHCSMKWATFLLSLKSSLEVGQGRPSPNDIKIDNWN